MLGTRLYVLVKVLVLARAAIALLPEDLLEDRVVPISLQEECASKCPNLDLMQNRTDDLSSEIGCGVKCKIDQQNEERTDRCSSVVEWRGSTIYGEPYAEGQPSWGHNTR